MDKTAATKHNHMLFCGNGNEGSKKQTLHESIHFCCEELEKLWRNGNKLGLAGHSHWYELLRQVGGVMPSRQNC